MRVWLAVASLLAVLAGAVPASAVGSQGEKALGPMCSDSNKVTSAAAPAADCLRVEMITTTEATASSGDVGIDSRPHTRTARKTTEIWLTRSGRRILLLGRVVTSEWFRYDTIDILDFQDPPTMSFNDLYSACLPLEGTLTGAYRTNDENDPVLAWAQGTLICDLGWPNPRAGRQSFDVRHEIYPHADGSYR